MTHGKEEQLGDYRLLEIIGEGGMAVVYRAVDTRNDREVAIKVISPHKQDVEKIRKRFLREIEVLAAVSHHNIVPILDFGEQEGRLFMVMPRYSSKTLKTIVEEHNKPYDWREAFILLFPVADALCHAHKQNILHRDVKPSNILFNDTNEPVLSDFGIAKLLDQPRGETLTSTGKTVGTPAYMAPEQFHEKSIDGRVDQYSIGVILYEMITGRKPYEAVTPSDYVWKQAREPFPRPGELIPNLPSAVEALILKLLEKDRSQRFESMEDLLAALQNLLEQKVEEPASKKPGFAFRFLIPITLLLVIITIAVIGFAAPGRLPLAFLMTKTPTPTITPTPSTTPTITTTPTLTPSPTITLTPTPIYTLGSTVVSDIDGMTLIYIPEGEFPMGFDAEFEYAAANEIVYVDSFWIDKTEVTNAMYKQCLEAGVCAKLDFKYGERYPNMSVKSYFENPAFKDYPVVFADINQAAIYCEWAGRRLPKDAEWEKAATGTEGQWYPWGNEDITDERANFCDVNCPARDSADNAIDDGHITTAPVGSYPSGASPYGALDMGGNVWEMVMENYIRGGAYNTTAITLTTFFRYPKPPDETGDHIGFRCAMDVQ